MAKNLLDNIRLQHRHSNSIPSPNTNTIKQKQVNKTMKQTIYAVILIMLTTTTIAETYTIFVADEVATSGNLIPLVQHRKQEYTVNYYMASTVETMSNAAIGSTYVLLVGTEDTVPSINTDAIVGRVPSNNPQHIQNWVAKTIAFEKQTMFANQKLGLIAGSQVLPPNAYITSTYFEQYLVPHYENWMMLKSYCYCNNSKSACIDADSKALQILNSNSPLIYFTGHGWNYWMVGCCNNDGVLDTNDVRDKLTNTIYPIVIGLSCSTANTAGDMGYLSNELLFNKHGAVAYIGTSDITGTKVTKDNMLITRILEEETLGKAFNDSGLDNFNKRRNLSEREYELLGDPALKLRIQSEVEEQAILVVEAQNETNAVTHNPEQMSRNQIIDLIMYLISLLR